jgi:hypothetical protein
MPRIFIGMFIAIAAIAGCASGPYAPAEPTEVTSTRLNAPINDLDGAPAPAYSEYVDPTPYVRAGEVHPAPKAMSVPRAMKAIACDIRVRRSGGLIKLNAVANLGRSSAGEYAFVITRSGVGGSSDITQGGPFDGKAGEHIDLSASEISIGRGDGYRATLTLSTPGGREICRRVIRS